MVYVVISLSFLLSIWSLRGFKLSKWIIKILYYLFDYRAIYIIQSGNSNKFKIGISVDPVERLIRIDKSIKGSKEKLIFYRFVFGARFYEKVLRNRYKESNFVYEGSGKTEWHRIRKSLEVQQVKGYLNRLVALQGYAILLIIGSLSFIILKLVS
jgi:hypothetical protein